MYLKSLNLFEEKFLNYLRTFNFTCDLYSLPEGSLIFENEPILVVKGPIIQAQLIETMLLLTINHQSLIATKARRIVHSAKGSDVVEFGARRAHSYDAATLGARAAFIGGVVGTSCTLAAQKFNIPIYGTMAHAWVQMFDSEYEAFLAYAMKYPQSTVLLIDTYDVLKSGIVNAIKVAKQYLIPNNSRLKAVRLDSGDLARLSNEVRTILDENGLLDCKILASNALDEYIIQDLKIQNDNIDIYGVGERLITSTSQPVFGGVYKLVALFKGQQEVYKIKVSENITKTTNPGFKKLYRAFNRHNGMMAFDLVCLDDEIIDFTADLKLYNPLKKWVFLDAKQYVFKELLVKIFDNGKLIYNSPELSQIKEFSKNQLNHIGNEHKRLRNPQLYSVMYSESLMNNKNKLISKVNDIL